MTRKIASPVSVPSGVPGNERIGAFSDGVFAIAITLLVLELHVPEEIPPGGLWTLVPKYLPMLAGHAVSFVVLGVYWVAHHNMFMHIKRHNRVLLWLNIGFLMFVAAMPFFAGLITLDGEDILAIVAYAGNLMLAGVALATIWWYATTNRRLVDSTMTDEFVGIVMRRVLLAPILYLLAIAVAFFSQTLARLFVLVVVLLYVFPNPLDVHHHRQIQGSTVDSDLEGE